MNPYPIFVKVYLFETIYSGIRMSKLSFEREAGEPWRYVNSFMAVNIEFRPIPPLMVAICCNENPNFPFNTTNMRIMYDPFTYSECKLRFITFITPQTYTSPLYLFGNTKRMIITFNKEKIVELPTSILSPISVLTEYEMSNTVKYQGDWFKGEFKFKNDFGRCIPDANGVKLTSCVAEIYNNKTKPFSLLDYIDHKTKKEKRFNIRDILNYNIVIGILLLVFFGCLYRISF